MSTLLATALLCSMQTTDLNHDGHVNVLDVAITMELAGPPSAPGSETIHIETDADFVEAGDVFTILVRLSSNTTPLFGYSVEVVAVPIGGATGSVNAVQADFFMTQNLIAACPCGAVMDPDFSVALVNPDGTAFVSSNTDDGSTVLASDGVNDILAQVCLSPAPGSSGQFELRLGLASALADGNGQPVTFVEVSDLIEAFPNEADIDLDGEVGFGDLLAVLGDWGECTGACSSDIDGSGAVDFNDLLIVLSTWGPPPGSCP